MKTIPITLRRAVFFWVLAAIVCPLSGIGFQHFGGPPVVGVLAAAAFVWFLLLFMEVGFTELTGKQMDWWFKHTVGWGCGSFVGSLMLVPILGILLGCMMVGFLLGIPLASLLSLLVFKQAAQRYPSDDE